MSRKITASVTVWLRPVHHYQVRSVENIAAVREREKGREIKGERER